MQQHFSSVQLPHAVEEPLPFFPVQDASRVVLEPRPLQVHEREMYQQILAMMSNAHASRFPQAMYTDAYQHGKNTVQDLLTRSLYDPKTLEAVENDCYLNGRRGSFEVLQSEKHIIPELFIQTAWEDLPSRIDILPAVNGASAFPFRKRRCRKTACRHLFHPKTPTNTVCTSWSNAHWKAPYDSEQVHESGARTA